MTSVKSSTHLEKFLSRNPTFTGEITILDSCAVRFILRGKRDSLKLNAPTSLTKFINGVRIYTHSDKNNLISLNQILEIAHD